MKKVILTAAFILAGSGLVYGEELPSKNEVLARFIDAVGGEEVLLARSVVTFEGTIITHLAWKDPPHVETPFRAHSGNDCNLRYAESKEWQDLPHQDTGEPSTKLRWLMHPAYALVVEDFFPDLGAPEREIRGGRPVWVMKPAAMDPAHYGLYFDEETGLLVHIGYFDDLLDWQEVDGVLFPHEMTFSRKGGHTTYRFEVVKATD